jgi:hypothetical protein
MANYRIRVKGRVDGAWSDYLGNLTIHPQDEPDGSSSSCLSGELPDQTTLIAILHRLVGLGYELISAEKTLAFVVLGAALLVCLSDIHA